MGTQIEANKLVTSEQTESKDSLKDFLYWPTTPQRKGKRQSDHDPYVLTSTQWKKIKTDKETKRQKRNRKRSQKTETGRKQITKR